MRILTAAVILATAATSTSTVAFAQTRLSDSQFIKAARCSGLAGDDAGRFDSIVKANKRGRADFVLARAMTAKDDAVRQVRRAGEGGKAEIQAELAGVCAGLGA